MNVHYTRTKRIPNGLNLSSDPYRVNNQSSIVGMLRHFPGYGVDNPSPSSSTVEILA
jgi:hypothetical protein